MKLGFTVSDLSASQLAFYLIKNANDFIEQENVNTDIIIFYENAAPPCIPLFCTSMHVSELWGFYEPVISTDLKTSQILLNCPSQSIKVFYVWDLEWIRMREKSYDLLKRFYKNNKLNLIARSLDHKKIIEDCWNTETIGTVENFNMRELWNCLQTI